MLRQSCLALAASATAVAAASLPAHSTPAIQNCGSLSRGPGSVAHGTGDGARCLLHAYDQHCRPAVYGLSLFGLDTIATDRFRLARTNGRCLVRITITFGVVPQPARRHDGVCRTLALQSGHVVAGGCFGDGVPKRIVLDPPPQSP